MQKTHDIECACKKCTAMCICRGCKETWQHKDLTYDGYCDDCERAHARLAKHAQEE
jgi:hypothetical protein